MKSRATTRGEGTRRATLVAAFALASACAPRVVYAQQVAAPSAQVAPTAAPSAVASAAPSANSQPSAGDAPPAPPPPWHPTQPLALRVATARAATDGVTTGQLPSTGTEVETGFAATVVPRPASEVALAIHDVNRYRELIPQVTQSQELRRTARVQEVFVRISVSPLPEFWARLRYRDETAADGALEIEGHSIEGNLDRMSLRWRLTPVEEGRATLVEFWALVLPTLPIPLPPGFLSREQVRTAQRGVTAVRVRFERGDGAGTNGAGAPEGDAHGARRAP